LRIYRGNIESIPELISSLKYLQELDLSYTRLKNIPDSVGKLKYLKILYLDGNLLTEIPDPIKNLKKLMILSISANKISKIESDFPKLKKIKKIILWDNRFRTLSNIPEKIIFVGLFDVNDLCQKGKYLVREKKKKEMLEFYKHSSLELSIQYNRAPNSLTDDEKERLIWEASVSDLRIAEQNSNGDDKIISEISKRLVMELPTGYKLMM
jgi:Leucine-rich repeat (LRR) protein